MDDQKKSVQRYFSAIAAALEGLDIFLSDDHSPLYRHGIIGEVLSEYLKRLDNSFSCWHERTQFSDRFRINRAESGYPVFQNILELEKDRATAPSRLGDMPTSEKLRAQMVDFILNRKAMPHALKRTMAERLYLENLERGDVFSPFILPRTIRVSLNPTNQRPYYVTHWGNFDGTANLPLIYIATIEDSTPSLVKNMVGKDGKLDRRLDIPLPVDGLLNPDLAHQFDQFAERSCSYSLTPATIANNLDEDFETLHPKQLRRIVLGPFYSAGITEHNSVVSKILEQVFKPQDAWMLTWTVQEVLSKNERPGKSGFWSSTPARQEYFIDTDDLDAARMGVSSYEKHALLPHEAYQLLYASGEAQSIFEGYNVHVLAGGQVISNL